MRKKLNRSQLKKKLDKFFSQYIRLRDSDGITAQCITCGKLDHYKSMHAGHFIVRGVMTTRWHERNVHAQCCGCNTYKFGEQAKYLIALERKYGRPAVDELMQLERDYRGDRYIKLTLPEIRDKVEYYKAKVKELE